MFPLNEEADRASMNRIWHHVRECWLILALAFTYVRLIGLPFSRGQIRSFPELWPHAGLWLLTAAVLVAIYKTIEVWLSRRAKKRSQQNAITGTKEVHHESD